MSEQRAAVVPAQAQFHAHDDLRSWVAAAVHDIVAELQSALDGKGHARLLVSGGGTPAPVYRALARQALDWARVEIALVDERWLPANDADSNTRLVQETLLTDRAAAAHFEPLLMPKLPVHVAFPVLIGAGGVAVMSVNDGNFWEDNFKSEASDAFMVIEPGIEVELNVTRFFRFCVGAYYLYTSEVDIQYPLENQLPYDILRGFSGGVTFKFGRF